MNTAPEGQRYPSRVTVASMIAAPAFLLASALVMPALQSDEQEQLHTIAAHSSRYLWFTLLLLAGTMLFVPAFHGLAWVTRQSRALRVGSALVVFGAMASAGDTTTQLLIRQMATRGHASAQMADVVSAFDSSTGAAQLFAVGGLALTAGGIAVAVALHRASLVAWPVAAGLAVALIANLVGFIAQSTQLIAGSSALLLITMAAIAIMLERRRNATSATTPNPPAKATSATEAAVS